MRYKVYEFNPDDAYNFARHVGIEVKEHGGELFFKTCPYCKPRATRGNVRTFSINLKTGQFKCLRASCGISGNMVTLSKDFDFSLGNEVDEYYRPNKKYKRLKQPKEAIKPKPEAIQYLESRGISEEVAKKYEITVQTSHPNILVFPFYDEKGVLQFVKYRKTDFDKTKDANKEWCEASTKPVLFGMKQCDDSFDTLVVVEGQLDSLAVATAGIPNAVSVPTGAKGFTWIPYCWDWLCKWKKIIVFGDFEKGSISLLDELAKRLKDRVEHVREDNYKDCKDANEILLKYGAEQVRKCVEESVKLPIDNVIDLADVKELDPYSIEKIPTGIADVDNLLCGGIPFGVVTIVTGKSGKGKSTFVGQIITRALNKGDNVFVYSGEMPNYLFKAAIDFQIAGPANVVEEDRRDYIKRYVRKSAKDKIVEWYRGKCMLYDRTMVKDEDTDLLNTIERMIVSQNARVIVIDNLMTMINKTRVKGSKLEAQSEVSNALEDMARFYNVCIILVAHKRKDSGIDDEDMDDSIRGDSDIVNSAGVIIHYNVNKDENTMENYPRIISVTKNRVFGRTSYRGWKVHYDEKSKRIYGDHDDLNICLGWDNESGGFFEDYDNSIFS
jgi:KaiC/GvpD/RAD55 family RecA-like ATPase